MILDHNKMIVKNTWAEELTQNSFTQYSKDKTCVFFGNGSIKFKSISPKGKYKFIDKNAAEVSSGVGKLNLKILPSDFDVYQNYPNPFNAETIVRYNLPKSEDVSIKIYDIMGREIFSAFYKKQSPGENSFIWKGNSNVDVLVSSGMYFLQMSAGKEVKRMKMIPVVN